MTPHTTIAEAEGQSSWEVEALAEASAAVVRLVAAGVAAHSAVVAQALDGKKL